MGSKTGTIDGTKGRNGRQRGDETEKQVRSWNTTARCGTVRADSANQFKWSGLPAVLVRGMAVAQLISIHKLEVYGMAMFDRTQIYISIAILALIEIAAVVASAASR